MDNSEIGNFFAAIGRRWLVLLIVFLIGLALLTVVARTVASYKANADLLIISEALKDTTLSDPDLPSILTSSEVLTRVISRLRLNTNPAALAASITTKLPIKSSVLELTYRDRDGVRAAEVANAIADEAALYFHEIATRGYTDVLRALNEQIAESQAKMGLANRLLQEASASGNFASSDRAIDDLSGQINQLRLQRAQINTSLVADKAVATSLARQLRTIDPIVHGEILQKDVVYQQLQTELAKDVGDLYSERASFRSSFPGLASLAQRVRRERSEIKLIESTAIKSGAGSSPSYTQSVLDGTRAAGALEADQGRLQSTSGELAAAEKQLTEASAGSVTINTLRARRDAAVQQYMTLAQRLSIAQADAAQGASLGRLVVVSRAISGPPSVPSTWLLGASILVFTLSFGAAYAYDAIDRRFWGAREIEKVYGRPVFMKMGDAGDF